MTSSRVGFYLPPTFEGKPEFDWPELEDLNLLNCELARHWDLQWPCWPHAKQMSPGFALPEGVKEREEDLKLKWGWPANEVVVADGWLCLTEDFTFCCWRSFRLRRALCSARRMRFSSSEPLANSSDKYSLTKSQPAADLSANLISLLRFLISESNSSR